MKVVIKTETGKRYYGDMQIKGDTATITGLYTSPVGRPSKQDYVREWQEKHPNGKPSECVKDLKGIVGRASVYNHFSQI